MTWESMVTVGRIVRPHGYKGAVVVQPETDFAGERFQPGVELSWKREADVAKVRIATSREFRGRWVVTFDGVDDMNGAEALRGLELRIDASALHPLAPGAHYVHDLEGCEVSTPAGERIGRVERVEFGSGTPILVVAGANGEVLVPLAEEICQRIEPAEKRITAVLPAGLLELNVGRGAGRER